MDRNIDQAALIGTAVAGVIAVSSAEGRYEPFDSVVGVVLAIVLIAFYRPAPAATSGQAWTMAAPPAAVGALTACLVLSFPVDKLIGALARDGDSPTDLATSTALTLLWVLLFAGLLLYFQNRLLASRRVTEPPADPPAPSTEDIH